MNATWKQCVLCSVCGLKRFRRVDSNTFSAVPRICDICNPHPLRRCMRPDTRARNILWNGVHTDGADRFKSLSPSAFDALPRLSDAELMDALNKYRDVFED